MLGILRRVFDFSSWQSSHPSDPPPGDMLDASFDAQNSKISELETHLLGVVRSDGNVQNGIISWDALHPEVILRLKAEILRETENARSETVISASEAVAARQVAENSALSAENARQETNLAKILTEDARQDAVRQIQGLISETEAVLARLGRAEVALNEARTDWDDAEGVAQAWSYASQEWAEHMPGTLPAETIAWMGITGDHWSSRWWANQAANAFGMLTSLYLGAHPEPPLTNNNGGPIETGAIYFDTDPPPGQMYVWDGSQWNSMTQPARAMVSTLWYSATAGQTVFPLTTTDLFGHNFTINATNPEPVGVWVNGVKLMPVQGALGDWNISASTITMQRPLRLEDLVSFDIYMPNSALGPGAVHAWKIAPLVGQDGVKTSFSMTTEAIPGVSVTVSKHEELVVSLDGVVQEPGVSYTASGANIVFVQAPATDSHTFITWFRPT